MCLSPIIGSAVVLECGLVVEYLVSMLKMLVSVISTTKRKSKKNKKEKRGRWKGGSVVRTVHGSCRRPELGIGCQHPHQRPHNYLQL